MTDGQQIALIIFGALLALLITLVPTKLSRRLRIGMAISVVGLSLGILTVLFWLPSRRAPLLYMALLGDQSPAISLEQTLTTGLYDHAEWDAVIRIVNKDDDDFIVTDFRAWFEGVTEAEPGHPRRSLGSAASQPLPTFLRRNTLAEINDVDTTNHGWPEKEFPFVVPKRSDLYLMVNFIFNIFDESGKQAAFTSEKDGYAALHNFMVKPYIRVMLEDGQPVDVDTTGYFRLFVGDTLNIPSPRPSPLERPQFGIYWETIDSQNRTTRSKQLLQLPSNEGEITEQGLLRPKVSTEFATIGKKPSGPLDLQVDGFDSPQYLVLSRYMMKNGERTYEKQIRFELRGRSPAIVRIPEDELFEDRFYLLVYLGDGTPPKGTFWAFTIQIAR